MAENKEKTLSIYEKLAAMRVELQKENISKSGKNDYSQYEYYELSDFLPACNRIADKYKTVTLFNINENIAALSVINCENAEDRLTFELPVANISVPGATAMQNIGAVTTYARRYLYMIAFEISENDTLDTTKATEKRIKEDEERRQFHEKELEAARMPINDIKINMIKKEMSETGISEKTVCSKFQVNAISEITEGIFPEVMKQFTLTRQRLGGQIKNV